MTKPAIGPPRDISGSLCNISVTYSGSPSGLRPNISLIVSAGAVLLDTVPSQNLVAAIRARLERGNGRVADLHLWRLGPGHSGLIVTIISERPQPLTVYKEQLLGIDGLSHITVGVHHCRSCG
jgi:Co/Zn/Cd efflux system component